MSSGAKSVGQFCKDEGGDWSVVSRHLRLLRLPDEIIDFPGNDDTVHGKREPVASPGHHYMLPLADVDRCRIGDSRFVGPQTVHFPLNTKSPRANGLSGPVAMTSSLQSVATA